MIPYGFVSKNNKLKMENLFTVHLIEYLCSTSSENLMTSIPHCTYVGLNFENCLRSSWFQLLLTETIMSIKPKVLAKEGVDPRNSNDWSSGKARCRS